MTYKQPKNPYAGRRLRAAPKPKQFSYTELESLVKHYESESRRTDRAPYHAEAARRLHASYSEQLIAQRKRHARMIVDAMRQDER